MLALSTKQSGIELKAVKDSFREIFLDEVVVSYENYLQEVKMPVIPALFFYGENSFPDHFIECFSILRASYMEEQFPEFDWETATEDEKEDMDQKVSEMYITEEEELMEDIGTALDHHQLFHIMLDEAYVNESIEIIVHHFHSPLQEVW